MRCAGSGTQGTCPLGVFCKHFSVLSLFLCFASSGDEAQAQRAELALAECRCRLLRLGLMLCVRTLSLAGLPVGDVRKVDYALDAIAAEDPFVDPDPLDEVVLEVPCLSASLPAHLVLTAPFAVCAGIPLAEGAFSR